MDTLRRIMWTAIIQADGLRKYTGRYPGKDMPVVFNIAIQEVIICNLIIRAPGTNKERA
jgi:hypothetical protein